MNKEKLHMQGRTTEGTIFELLFLVLILLAWGLTAWLLAHAPEVVPTHFGPSGQPDAWGSPYSALFPCILISVMGACLLAGAYFPHTVNMPFAVKSPRQQALSARLLRVLALLFAVLTAAIALSILSPVHTAWPVMAVVGLMLAVVAAFTVLLWRAR